MEILRIIVAWAAIAFAVLSFLVYFIKSVRGPKTEDHLDQASRAVAAIAPTTANVTDLVKALATLTDSLAKAGPALWSMIGSVLFLLIAAMAAGVFPGTASTDSGGAKGGAATTSPASSAPASSAPASSTPSLDGPIEENLKVPSHRTH